MPNGGAGGGALAPIDFSTFVVSLAGNVMVQLGRAPAGEQAPAAEPNLPLAQQTIDILAMLEDKTRGNLSEEEQHLLGQLLYECRMAFVQATSA